MAREWRWPLGTQPTLGDGEGEMSWMGRAAKLRVFEVDFGKLSRAQRKNWARRTVAERRLRAGRASAASEATSASPQLATRPPGEASLSVQASPTAMETSTAAAPVEKQVSSGGEKAAGEERGEKKTPEEPTIRKLDEGKEARQDRRQEDDKKKAKDRLNRFASTSPAIRWGPLSPAEEPVVPTIDLTVMPSPRQEVVRHQDSALDNAENGVDGKGTEPAVREGGMALRSRRLPRAASPSPEEVVSDSGDSVAAGLPAPSAGAGLGGVAAAAEKVLYTQVLARRTATARWLWALAQEKAAKEVVDKLSVEWQRLEAAANHQAAVMHDVDAGIQPEVQETPSPATTGEGGPSALEEVEKAVRRAAAEAAAEAAGASPGQDGGASAPRRGSPIRHPEGPETAKDTAVPSTSQGMPSQRPRGFRPAVPDEGSDSDDTPVNQSEQHLSRLQRGDARWRLVEGGDEDEEERDAAAARRRTRSRGPGKGKKGGRNFNKKHKK